MTVITYYRLAVALPLLLPLGFFLLFGIGRIVPWVKTLAELLLIPLFPVAFQLVTPQFWIIPYLILAGTLLIWMRDKTERQIRRASLGAPWLMVVVVVAYFAVYGTVQVVAGIAPVPPRKPAEHGSFLGVLLFFAPWILIVGYVYVWVVDALLRLLKRFEVVRG